jgi:hypothetical protein
MTEHLSYYALDRLRLGEPARPEERAHLDGCRACEAHLRRRDPLPGWLAGVQLPPPPRPVVARRPGRLGGWRLMVPAFAAAAVAAILVVVVPRTALRHPGPGVREKAAAPAVQLYVKRGDRVFTWQGRAVRAGDRLRVEVDGAGFGFVSVAGRSGGQEDPVLLYDGALAEGTQLLPLSFRVDAEGKQEILSVIFGRQRVPADLHARARESDPVASTWRQILVLDKEAP